LVQPVAKAVHTPKKKYHLHFSVVWIGSRSTFVVSANCWICWGW